MNNIGRTIAWWLTLAFWSEAALAGAISAELSRTQGQFGDEFSVYVVIDGNVQGEIKVPDVAGITMERTGSSSNYTWINGQSRVETRYTYSLYPDAPGDFTIGSFVASIDGTEMKTLPLSLKVTATSGGGQGQAQGGGQVPGTQRPGQEQQKGQTPPTEDIFIVREVSNDKPYVGEQVISTVKIFHRIQLSGGAPVKKPSPDVRRIEIPGESNYIREYQGKRYNVIELREILVPLRSGTVEVPPYVLNARIFRPVDPFGRGRDVWDMLRGGNFNFGQEMEVQVQSPEINLEVKALPSDNRPDDYSGLVGQFALRASVQKRKLEAFDTATITVTVEGQGLLDGLGDLPLSLDQIGKVYADKPANRETKDPTRGVQAAREYKFAVVPEKVGVLELGEVKLSVFDPKEESYKTLSAPLGQLRVLPSTKEEQPVAVAANSVSSAPLGGAGQKSVELLGEDLVGLHRDRNFLRDHELTSREVWNLGLLSGLPMLCLLGFYGFQFGHQLQSKRAAQSVVGAERLTRLQARFQEGEASVAELRREFMGFLRDTLKTSDSHVSPSDAQMKLQQLGVPEAVAGEAKQQLDRLLAWEFGGRDVEKGTLGEVARQVADLAERIEKAC